MQEIPWEGLCYEEAHSFAKRCSELKQTNPYDLVALDNIINTLMTELWDRGFSQTEIRTGFNNAVANLSRYAAGEERRGDRY